jgi:hypothetical protein
MPCRFDGFTIKASRFLTLVCFPYLALAHSFAVTLFQFSLYLARLSFLKPCTVNGVSSFSVHFWARNTEVVEHPSATPAHSFSFTLRCPYLISLFASNSQWLQVSVCQNAFFAGTFVARFPFGHGRFLQPNS